MGYCFTNLPFPAMRTLIFALLFITALLAAYAATNNIHSHLLVDVGKQFVLGGEQVGAFRVSARNSGPVPVLLLERSGESVIVTRGRLEPGQSARLTFAAGAAVLVRNLGLQRAEIDLDIKGPSKSKMVYEPVPNN